MERGDVFTKIPVVRSHLDGKTHCIGSVFLSPRDSEESAMLKIGEQLGPGLAPLLFEIIPYQLESPSVHPGDRPRVLPGWLSEHDSVLLAETTECAVSILIERPGRPQVSALISSQHTFDCLRRSLAVWLDCDQIDLEIVDDQGQVWRSSDRVISTISQRWQQFGRTIGAQQGSAALLQCKFSQNDAVSHRVVQQSRPSGVRLPPILLATASLARCGATQTQLSSVYLLPSSARNSIRSQCRDFEHAREHVEQLLRSLDLTRHSDAGAASGAGGDAPLPKHVVPWTELNVRILAAHCSGLEDLRIVGGLAAGGTATADVSAEDRAHAELLSAMGQLQVCDTNYEGDKAPEGPRPTTSRDAAGASLPLVRRTAAVATSGNRHSRLPSTTLLKGIRLSIESLPRSIPRLRVSIDENHHEDAAMDSARTAHARPRRDSTRHPHFDMDAVRASYNLLAAAAAPHRARARLAGQAGTLVEQLEAAWPLLASTAVGFHQYPASAASTRASAVCAQVRSRLAPAAVKHATSGCTTMQRLARMVSPAASARRFDGSQRSGAAAGLPSLGPSDNDTHGLQLEGGFMPTVRETPGKQSDGAVGGSTWMKQIALIFAAWSWYDLHRARVTPCIAEYWCAELESTSNQTVEATVLCAAGCIVSCHLFAETQDSARRIPPVSLAKQNAGAGFWAALLGCAMAMYTRVCSSGGARKNSKCSSCCSAMGIPDPVYDRAVHRSNACSTVGTFNAAKLTGSPGSASGGDTLVIQGSFMAPPRCLLEYTPSSSTPSASATSSMAQPRQRGQRVITLRDQRLSASSIQQVSRTQTTTLVDYEGSPTPEPEEGMRLPRAVSGKADNGACQQLSSPTTPRRLVITAREPSSRGVAVNQDTTHPTGTIISDPSARGKPQLPTRQDVPVGQILALGIITVGRSTPLSSIAQLVRRARWVPASSRPEAMKACDRHSISGCGSRMHQWGLLTISSARLLHECIELSSPPLQAMHYTRQSTFGALRGCPFEEVIQLKATKAFRAAMQPVAIIAREAGRSRTVIDSVMNRSDRGSTPAASVAGAREVGGGAQAPAETGSQGPSYGQHASFVSSIGEDSGNTWHDSPQDRSSHGQTRILSGRVLPADLVDALERSIMSKRRAAWSITLRLLSVEAETALEHARSTNEAGDEESLVAQCCRESEALIDQLLDDTPATHTLLAQCSSISQCWAKHITHHESRAVDAFNALFDDEQSYFGFQEFVKEKLPDQWPRVQSLLEILDIESQWKEVASILDQVSSSQNRQEEQAFLDRAQEIVCQCIAGYILVGLQLQHLEGTVDDLSKQRLLLLGPLIGVAFVRPSYTEEVLQALGIQAGDIDSMLSSEQQLPVLGSVLDPLDQDSLGRDRAFSIYNAQSSGLQAFHVAVKCLGGGAMHVNLHSKDTRRRMPPPPSDVFGGIAEQMCDYVLKNVAPDWLESREGQLALARRVPVSPTSKGESVIITTEVQQEKETDLSLTDPQSAGDAVKEVEGKCCLWCCY